MKLTIIATIFALTSGIMAAPSPITSLRARTPETLDKRAGCPAPGTGNVDPCCHSDGPDGPYCRSRRNCYTRCGPSGPIDHGGPIGCILGKPSLLQGANKTCALTIRV
ncbi:hypothetical protein BKA63DRAFT_428456 [Paraphoma chrysanthemicola]|nr:hypothetical protein BKA63DRAFT_428456 [Paraphoma chrysanthemicola]